MTNSTFLWKETFAWLPVTTITGKRVWLKKVFKRRVKMFINQKIETQYATAFDMFKDPYEVKWDPELLGDAPWFVPAGVAREVKRDARGIELPANRIGGY